MADPICMLPLPQEEPEPASLLSMRLRAITWASKAKDSAISALESKLRSALEIARAGEAKLGAALAGNRLLERELQGSRVREEALIRQVHKLRDRLETSHLAEERLASQMGDLEAEALEHMVKSNKLIDSLNSSLKEKDRLLEKTQRELEILGTSNGGPAGDDAGISELPTASHDLHLLEKKLAETDSARRAVESELRELKKSFAILQEQLEVEVITRRQMEKMNKELLAQSKRSDEDGFLSVKVKDLGMRLKVWDTTSLAVRNGV